MYSNNKQVAKVKGTVEGRKNSMGWGVTFGEYSYWEDGEVALSEVYNPYPRKSTIIYSDFPAEFAESGVIAEINNKYCVDAKIKELCIVDLDGDGKNEYLAYVVDYENYFFAKCLISSEYKVISYLIEFKEEEADFFDSWIKFENLLDTIEIIDIDNDNALEIIVYLSDIECFDFEVFCYKEGKLELIANGGAIY